jgi:hypothetical protein
LEAAGEFSPRRHRKAQRINATRKAPVRSAGSIAVLEEDGTRYVPRQGTIRIWGYTGMGPPERCLGRIVEGEWSVVLRSWCRDLQVGRLLLDGREAFVSKASSNKLPAGASDLAVEARWLPSTWLRVVDRRTGDELKDIEVMAGGGERLHPGADRSEGPDNRTRAASSPVLLTPWRRAGWGEEAGLQSWWVRADGYAWGKVDLDLGAGGEREIRLVPGGGLMVEIDGRVGCESEMLRIRPEGMDRFFAVQEHLTKAAGSLHLESLPSGAYEVTLECHDDRQRECWGMRARRTVNVVAGETASVRIEPDEVLVPVPVQALPRVSVRGTLTIPSSWSQQMRSPLYPMLVLKRLEQKEDREFFRDVARIPLGAPQDRSLDEDSELVEQKARTLMWEARDLQPGSYAAFVLPFGHSHAFTLDSHGPDAVAIEIPPCAEVEVRLVEGGTGLSVPGSVGWLQRHPAARMPENFVPADSETGLARFQAAIGRITLLVHAPGWTVESSYDVDVQLGANSFEIELWRHARIELVFMDGNTTVPAWAKPTSEDLSGNLVRHELDLHELMQSGRTILGFAQPGRYRIAVAEHPDFEPIPIQEVEVGSEERAVVIQLMRRKPE